MPTFLLLILSMLFPPNEPVARTLFGVQVLNRGVSGNNVADLLNRVEKDVLAEKPDLVILMVGTNDMVNSKKLLPVPQYARKLDSLVRRLQASGAQVLLLSILPVDEEYLYTRHPKKAYDEAPTARVKKANEIIKQTAARRQVAFLDMYAAFVARGKVNRTAGSFIRNEANSGKPDGVHPTPAGYRFMAGQMAGVIRSRQLLKKNTAKVICFGDSITFGLYVAGEGTSTGETYPAGLAQLL